MTRGWPARYPVVLLAALAVFVCYMDRVVMSITIIPMAAEFGWSPEEQGRVLSSFFVGYLLTQIAGGWLAERYGGVEQWGSPIMDPHYSAAWAWAGNTPFQWGKQVASHLGGTRNPMVISWPRRIRDRGGLRSQFTHAIDVAPTLLEFANLPTPAGMQGKSIAKALKSGLPYFPDLVVC